MGVSVQCHHRDGIGKKEGRGSLQDNPPSFTKLARHQPCGDILHSLHPEIADWVWAVTFKVFLRISTAIHYFILLLEDSGLHFSVLRYIYIFFNHRSIFPFVFLFQNSRWALWRLWKLCVYVFMMFELGVTIIKGWEVFGVKGGSEAGRVESVAVSEFEFLMLSGSPILDPSLPQV